MRLSFLRLLSWIGHIATPLILLVLIILSVSPSVGTAGLFTWVPFFDKIAHGIAYAALGCSLFWSMAAGGCTNFSEALRKNRFRTVGSWILLVSIGAAVEWIQPQFGRSAEWLDLVSDGIGGLLGILIGVMTMVLAARIDVQRSEQ